MIGEKLRAARRAQGLSLNDIAGKAAISTATLSRIETSKQALDLALFLRLAAILELNAGQLIQGENEVVLKSGLVQAISSLQFDERMELWQQLTEAARRRKAVGPRRETRKLAMQIEELLAQLDFLREEIESVRRRIVIRR
ncbi:MAG TPA: helix-turn-helix transcriptional regulator [Thermoanaerobaculia bacterium]|nr:helix-turn-helix transcriptional regulator [Thermoanaerobaculia bacterium]